MATLTPINAAAPLAASDDSRHTFTGGTTETTSFALDNVDTEFETMLTASWTIEYRQVGRGDDTLSLSLRVMSGSTVLAAADSGGTFVSVNADVQNTTDTTAGPTAFAYVNTTADKTTWDAAVVEIQQTYSQQMGPDNASIEVDWFQLTGTYDPASTPVEPDDAFHLHTASEPTVTQTHDAAPANATHLHTAQSPTVSQVHEVAPANAAHPHTASSPVVDITHIVNPNSATHLHVTSSPTVTQIHEVTAQSATHLHTAGSPVVSQTHDVVAQFATHLHTAGSPTVDVTSIIDPNDAVHLHTAQSPTITQTYKVLRLKPDGTAEAGNFAEGTVNGTLMVLSHINGVTVYGELVETGTEFVLDDTNKQVKAVEFIEV